MALYRHITKSESTDIIILANLKLSTIVQKSLGAESGVKPGWTGTLQSMECALYEIAPCTVLHLQFGQLDKPHANFMIDESAESYQA